MEICDRTLSDEIKAALRLPAFDSYEWEDEDVLFLMQTMFIDTGLVDKFKIPLATLREWLYEVYKHYNAVPFHNFRHCFCVAQMVRKSTASTRKTILLSSTRFFICSLDFCFLCVLCMCLCLCVYLSMKPSSLTRWTSLHLNFFFPYRNMSIN